VPHAIGRELERGVAFGCSRLPIGLAAGEIKKIHRCDPTQRISQKIAS